MDNKLAVVKYDTVMMKALPSDVALTNQKVSLGLYLEDLLSLNGEMPTKRLELILKNVESLVGELSLKDIKDAFMLHVRGMLPTKPKTNFLDIVLFSIVVQEFREQRKIKSKVNDLEKEKEIKDFMYVVGLFDYFIQERNIPTESVWVYTYLEEKDILDYSKARKQKVYDRAKLNDKENAEDIAKCNLIKRYFEKLEAKGKHLKDIL